jgi:hypothetical protein
MTATETADETGEEHSLTALIDSLVAFGERDRVSVNELLAAFEDRSRGVLVTFLGLLASLPVIGALPGISVTVALLLLLVVAPRFLGPGRLRLPGRLGRLSLRGAALARGVEKSRGVAGWIDRRLARRLTPLSESRAAQFAIRLCIAGLALAMIPLAFVPGAVTPATYGVTVFGLALIARDGLLALIGYVFVLATVATGVIVLV